MILKHQHNFGNGDTLRAIRKKKLEHRGVPEPGQNRNIGSAAIVGGRRWSKIVSPGLQCRCWMDSFNMATVHAVLRYLSFKNCIERSPMKIWTTFLESRLAECTRRLDNVATVFSEFPFQGVYLHRCSDIIAKRNVHEC